MPFREIILFNNLILNQENHVVHLKLACLLDYIPMYLFKCVCFTRMFYPKDFKIILSILDYEMSLVSSVKCLTHIVDALQIEKQIFETFY